MVSLSVHTSEGAARVATFHQASDISCPRNLQSDESTSWDRVWYNRMALGAVTRNWTIIDKGELREKRATAEEDGLRRVFDNINSGPN